jgi:flagellin
MGLHTQHASRAAERAASGFRVNRASDDAAGMAIGESLQAQVRGTLTASRNILDGISLLNTADAAVSQIANALHRMRELAVQSANSTYDSQQRQVMELEFMELRGEIEYATRQANFNGYYLLRGGSVPSWDTLSRTVSDTSAGATSGPYAITPRNAVYGPAARTVNGLGEQEVTLAGLPAVYGLGTAGPQSMVVEATDTGTGMTRTIPFDAANGFTYNAGPNSLTFHGAGAPGATENVRVRYVPAASLTQPIGSPRVSGTEAVSANGAPVPNAGGPGGNGYYISGGTVSLVGSARPDAAGGPVTWSASYMTESVNAIALDTETGDYGGGLLNPASLVVSVNGVPVAADPANGYSVVETATDEVGGTLLYGYEVQLNGASRVSGAGPHTISVSYDFDQPTAVDPLEFIVQEGANEGETKSLLITRLTVGGLGLAASHIDTQVDAQNVLTTLNTAIDRMNMLRGSIGSYQSTLDHAYNNVMNASVNQSRSYSFIRDADMAAEVSDMTRATILRDGAMGAFTEITTNSNYLLQLLGA